MNRQQRRANIMGQRTRPVIRSYGLHPLSKEVLDLKAVQRENDMVLEQDAILRARKKKTDLSVGMRTARQALAQDLPRQLAALLAPKRDLAYRGFQSSINTKAPR